MNLLLESRVWDNIYNTFSNIFSGIGQAIRDNIVIAIITFAILLILIVYRSIKNRFTTEVTTYKAINRINEYLAKNPFITEENLVEFNRIMMDAPKTLRFQWQRYIINRDKKPSTFLSEENCITRPLRTNSYKQGLNTFLISTVGLAIFSALFLIAGFIVNTDTRAGTMLLSLIIPAISLFVSLIYMLLGNILYNAIMMDLYFSYANFEKNIDRAVTTMPEAIDYEIIFTPKEIQNGIPALQEFLEQRALYDQEQLQKAKESEVEHETYNFDSLGVNGSLVMQRALKESEMYLGNRRRLLNEIETIQSEKTGIQKDFDEENKNYQRNIRDISEEISSLKSKIEVVTNEITRSSLRRQQAAEVEKKENIEKEVEKATAKFNDKINKLNAEIEKRRKEIDDSKVIAEKSLSDEFKHFSDKIYKDLQKVVSKEVENQIKNLNKEKEELAKNLEEKDKLMAEKLALYEDKVGDYDNLSNEVNENHFVIDELKNEISGLNQNIEDKEQELFEVKQELEHRKKEILKKDDMISNFKKKKAVEIYRYFDAEGNEFYFDDNDNAYYLDENGNAVYYNSETVESEPEVDNSEVSASETSDNESKQEKKSKKRKKKEKDNEEEINEDVVEETEEPKEEGYKGIQDTLNKLAKAAEEKMKAEKNEENSNTKTSSKTTKKETNKTTTKGASESKSASQTKKSKTSSTKSKK